MNSVYVRITVIQWSLTFKIIQKMNLLVTNIYSNIFSVTIVWKKGVRVGTLVERGSPLWILSVPACPPWVCDFAFPNSIFRSFFFFFLMVTVSLGSNCPRVSCVAECLISKGTTAFVLNYLSRMSEQQTALDNIDSMSPSSSPPHQSRSRFV